MTSASRAPQLLADASSPTDISPANLGFLTGMACLAIGLPALLAYNLPPSATFFNQAAALIAWGGFVAACVLTIRPDRDALWRARIGVTTSNAGIVSLMLGLAVVFAAGFVTLWKGGSTRALELSSAGSVAAAALAALTGATVSRGGGERTAMRVLCIGLVFAGFFSVVISLIQVYWPDVADGTWIAQPAVTGRASGNLRQPNHLCSLLLWSLIALAWLREERLLPGPVLAALGASFVYALVLTASRTGWIGEILLVLWGIFDYRLSKSTRLGLIASGIAYLGIWTGLTAWAHATNHVFYGATRLEGPHDISSSRFGIWANTWSMIKLHPWTGVGWGDFNFAWTLTPFPGRPVAFFDHTHNFVLQMLVELGVPVGGLVLLLITAALVLAIARAWRVPGPRGTALRTALMVVIMMVVHSQLEYPLWYVYFLLPTAFALGLCLGGNTAPDASKAVAAATPAVPAPPNGWRVTLALGGALLALGGGLSVVDYSRVVSVFAPADDDAPLEERIAEGERSVLFSHHAAYAAATTAVHPSEELPSLHEASHYLLDTRFMIAWAKALAERGETEKARYLADRLREFRNEDAKPFFDVCEEPAREGKERPFQCTAATQAFRYEDFR